MSKSYLGAAGIAVSDLEASAAFYTEMLGMVELQTIDVSGMKQIVLGFEGVRGASVLLMKHADDKNRSFELSPVKLVFYVADTAGILEAVRAANYVVEKEAAAFAPMGGAIIGFAKDPDGHLIELIQKPARE